MKNAARLIVGLGVVLASAGSPAAVFTPPISSNQPPRQAVAPAVSPDTARASALVLAAATNQTTLPANALRTRSAAVPTPRTATTPSTRAAATS